MLRKSLAAVLIVTCMVSLVRAEDDKGQADLDKATDLQLKAETLAELKEVADLCESAIKKGLGAENKKFAVRLLTSSLYQRANRYQGQIFGRNRNRRGVTPEQLNDLRTAALKDLNRLLKHNKTYANAYLSIARLNAVRGGDRKKAVAAATKAIELLKDDKTRRVDALVVRSQVSTNERQQLADLNEAVKLAPNNQRVWQARFQFYVTKRRYDDAATDLKKLIKANPTNDRMKLALAELLGNAKKYDDAFKVVDELIKRKPKSLEAYQMRSRINQRKNDLPAAIKDLSNALKVRPNHIGTILMRGGLNLRAKKYKAARADANNALKIREGLPQAILLRVQVAEAEKKFPLAIRDTITLLQLAPQGSGIQRQLQLQLAFYYAADKRPRRAVKLYNRLLKADPGNFLARQARADTSLSIGDHKTAIKDYEVLLKARPKHDGVLNNLAWTLATSPDKEIRNGKRAIQLGLDACKVTQYKKPHILSTLAAAYAEAGDFKKAIEWSTKAVELQKKNKQRDIGDQLKKELESYKKKKPWRERQNVKENKAPLGKGKNLIEA